MTFIIKFFIEVFAILLIWTAINYKRKKILTPFISRHWWIQFTLVVSAIVIFKIIKY